MTKRSKWMIAAGIVVLFILLVLLAWRWMEAKQNRTQSKQPVQVTVESMKTITKQPQLSLTGSLEGEVSTAIGAKIGGRVLEVLTDDGASVQAGQTLVRLESREAMNQVRMAEEAVLKAQAQLDNAQVEYERMATLFHQAAISKQQLDMAETHRKVAQADMASAQASLATAKEQEGYAEVTAPISGVAANRNVSVGQVVAAGQQLLTVERLHPLYAVVQVEQKDLSALRVGLEARVQVDTYPGEDFVGRVTLVNPAADTGSRLYRVKVLLDNPAGRLKPGMFVTVILLTGAAVQVDSVPRQAVFQKDGLYYVFVMQEGRVVQKEIKIGQVLGERLEVRSGLDKTDAVITSNVNKLKEGDAVEQGGGGQS